ncbi:MAG: proton-conducting transporter membrane subunit [Eubacteriales bacterium]|nr:proton-conducting transporter membrane subunit [Eubacteriales bacterium]
MENSMFLLAVIVFFPMVGAFVSYIVGRQNKKLRDNVVGGIAIVEFLMLLFVWLQTGTKGAGFDIPGFCGMGLHFTVDGFRVLYGTIAAFMWMMTSLFSKEYFGHYRNRNRYYLFQLLTLGATEGIFLSADLYTTFIFFEVMSMASYVWVAQDERAESMRAAATYLAVAVIGGLVMLMGIFLLYNQTGTLTISELHAACEGKNMYLAAGLMFFGFGAKAGAFPLHIWLPKAHPVAPAPASALLSGILTKTGVFGILVISCQIFLHDWKWGTFVLLIGTVTMFAGAILALFSIDFKRTLACSSVSQIGFILVGIGMQGLLGEENALAVRGSLLHMVNHSLFKLLLFMVAGVIYMNLHKLDLNDIRGFGRKKPFLAVVYLCGALGIGGIPLFSGYVSKTLIHESIVEYMEELHESTHLMGWLSASDIKIIEWIFLISGGLTVAYMCKLFIAVFIEKNKDAEVQAKYDAMSKSYMSLLSKAVLGICAILFPVMGSFPHMTMDKLADQGQGFMGLQEFTHTVHYFSLENLKGGIISIAIGVVIYIVVARGMLMEKENRHVKNYVNRWPKVLDLEDYLYRPILLTIIPVIAGTICAILDHFVDFAAKILPISPGVETGLFDTIKDSVVILFKKHVYQNTPLPHELEEGNALTNSIGKIGNRINAILNATFRRKNPKTKDYTHILAMKHESMKASSGLIGRSLSYGLILFAIGLCGTLIYLLIVLIGWMK